MVVAEMMDKFINNGMAVVVKRNQRPSKSGITSTVVNMGELELKSCNVCGMFKELRDYTANFSFCKECRAKQSRDNYYTDFDAHIRQRWYSLTSKSSKEEDKCTLEELKLFCRTKRDKFTNRTVEEDFYNPHHNSLERLEIDHIRPVSEGGKSTIENFQVVPSWYNRAKMASSYSEWKEIEMKYISTGVGV